MKAYRGAERLAGLREAIRLLQERGEFVQLFCRQYLVVGIADVHSFWRDRSAPEAMQFAVKLEGEVIVVMP